MSPKLMRLSVAITGTLLAATVGGCDLTEILETLLGGLTGAA